MRMRDRAGRDQKPSVMPWFRQRWQTSCEDSGFGLVPARAFQLSANPNDLVAEAIVSGDNALLSSTYE